MSTTILHTLSGYGQSIWLDYISRTLIESGRLKAMIEDGLRGMTSNPTIFNQAISQSKDYDHRIARLLEAGKSTFEIYDELTIRDIQDASDLFLPIYQTTDKLDGYVSLEINPQLARDTEASMAEGKRLFRQVNRPNVMIKVPSTPEGFPVIEELLAEGINVNVTLIFSLKQYEQTARAYLRGMSRLSQKIKDLSGVRSVASVFVSRIDTAIDKSLQEKIAGAKEPSGADTLKALLGKAAVANCAMVFEKFQSIFNDKEFSPLARKKAQVQRVLWASTGTKNPAYSDLKYVTELIARPTVNTLPEATITALLNHGRFQEALGADTRAARDIIAGLKKNGIDIDAVCDKLLSDGVVAFEKSFAELLKSIETKSKTLCASS